MITINQHKTVLITGASSGFGKLTAQKLLAADGWTVYVGARDTADVQSLTEAGAVPLKLDVTSDKDVFTAINTIIKRDGRIDGLVANAGYGLYGTVEHLPLEQVQSQFDVNLYGVARVVRAVLPHMRRAGSGRIVITTSVAAYASTAGMGWYSASKFAVRGLADGLRQEVAPFGVSVSMIEPGTVKTGFEDTAFDPMERLDQAEEYQPTLNGFKRYMHRSFENAPGPEPVAEAMVAALTAERPKPHYRPTRGGGVIIAVRKLLPTRAYDWLIRKLFSRSR